MSHTLSGFGVPWILYSSVWSTPLGNLSMLFNPGCPCLGNITLVIRGGFRLGQSAQVP